MKSTVVIEYLLCCHKWPPHFVNKQGKEKASALIIKREANPSGTQQPNKQVKPKYPEIVNLFLEDPTSKISFEGTEALASTIIFQNCPSNYLDEIIWLKYNCAIWIQRKTNFSRISHSQCNHRKHSIWSAKLIKTSGKAGQGNMVQLK